MPRRTNRVAATRQQRQHAEQFRATFLDAIRPYIGMPLLLSGGVDSATNLAALLALGEPPPRCYTFQLGEIISSDLAVARAMCAHFNVPHTTVRIPQNEATLIADIQRVLPLICRLKKVHVQVAQCFLYLADAVVADGARDATLAMAADDLWGSARAIAAYVKSQGEDWCRAMRREYITYTGGSDESTARVAKSRGLTLHEVWTYQPLVDFMLALDYADLHVPVAKGLALRAFPEFWTAGAWYRPNSSLQVNSGVREWHDTLLASPTYNPKRARAIIAVYREMARALGLDEHRDYLDTQTVHVSRHLPIPPDDDESESDVDERASALIPRRRHDVRTAQPISHPPLPSNQARSTATASSPIRRSRRATLS